MSVASQFQVVLRGIWSTPDVEPIIHDDHYALQEGSDQLAQVVDRNHVLVLRTVLGAVQCFHRQRDEVDDICADGDQDELYVKLHVHL